MVVVALRPAPRHERLLSQLGDDALALRVAYGDDAAFSLLYERYAARLCAYAGSIAGDDAGDVVQAAMAKALVALRGTTLDRGVAPWLFRVVRNEAIDALRRRRDHVPLDALSSARVEDASAAVLRREELAFVVADVRALPGSQRRALALRVLDERSHVDIARRLGTTPAAARQAVHAARVRLREQSAQRA